MRESGTFVFSDPDDFRAHLRKAGIELFLTVSGDFKARLTRLELPHLRLLHIREERPRIAYVSLARKLVFVTFAAQPRPPLLWGGVELRPSDVVFHSQGEHMHQRTTGACHWAAISQTPEHLAACGEVLTGKELVPPPVAQVLRLPPSAGASLRQLHADARRLVEKKPELIAHPEVARALEQDLIYTLVTCLSAGAHCQRVVPRRHRADIMRQFQDAIAAHSERVPHLPDLCKAIGVPERTLRVCCAEFLGTSPIRYLRLQRLARVRAALRHADPATANVSDIARRHGFLQLGRFAAQYRAVFGEAPSTTLQRATTDTHATIPAESA
jgi:methylphosphotriester-DNA--protein-cysteine methyltransferase